jgi:hypothetical protein
MKMANLSLQQIADRISMHSYVLSTETTDLSDEDLTSMSSDLERMAKALLVSVNHKEKENV